MSEPMIPRWRRIYAAEGVVVAPDERVSTPQTLAMGVQHVVAMFGATVLAPLLMGFDANVAILMSGVSTLIFFLFVKGQVPSYLGSSFAFIGGVIAVTGYAGVGANPNIGVALGAIIVCGLVYALVGALVWYTSARPGGGTAWIEALMPPVVTGAVVAVIGLHLAPIAARSAVGDGGFDAFMAIVTMLCVGGVAVYTRGVTQRLLILIGLILACVIYAILANGFGWGVPMDFSAVAAASWVGLPQFSAPEFRWEAMGLIVPVVVILVAENLGHIKAVAAMTGRNLDGYIGRAFVGDGVATMVSGSVGGTGMTTYAENIGVMSVTRIYSTLIFVVAGVIAILLGFSPKFGALIHAIPGSVLGGVSVVVFGLITVAGARIWIQNRVDFSDSKNLVVVAITLIFGAGNFTLTFGGFSLNGLGTATFGAIFLYWLLNRGQRYE